MYSRSDILVYNSIINTKIKILKFSVYYLVGFYTVSLPVLLWFKSYGDRNFSETALESMISSQSRFRDSTTDVCKYSIYGDPVAAGDEFARISLICSKDVKAASTISLKAVRGRSFREVLTEYARVIGFDPKIIFDNNSLWRCVMENETVKDINISVPNKANIECTKL